MQLFLLLCRIPGKISLRYFLPFAFLFACHLATGQVVKTTAPAPGKKASPVATPSNQVASTGGSTPASLAAAAKAPLARNMEDFKKTPQYAKRKAAYDKKSPGPQSKTVKFQDGSRITISLDKEAPSGPMTGPVKKKIGPEKKESSGGYDCIVNNVSLSANSNSFLNNDYSGSTANIYPGACYTYANLTNGSWKETTGPRNAVMITTDNPNATTSFITVQNPNVGTLYAAVAKLFAGMKGPAATESLVYNVTDAENSSTYNLQIGAAASGYGVDLSNVYTTGNQSNHVHLTIDATKTLFTISTAPPDSGFFSDPKIEATPYLSVIGEVSYGVRILANADLTFSSQSDADVFKGSYSGYGVSVSLKVKFSSSAKGTSTTINGYMIGGPGGQVVAYTFDELQKQIDDAFAHVTYQNARPIKYKAYSMAGDVLNTYSATDEFAERSCTPSDGGSVEIQNVIVNFTQGGDGKEAPTQFIVGLFAGLTGNPYTEEPMFIYNSNGAQNYYANNGTATIVLNRNPKYKGKYDEETLQKTGGHLHMYPLNYKPNSASGIGADIWQITNVQAIINPKASTVNPNPLPIGGKNGINWQLNGPNQVNLHSDKNTTADWLFNANFTEIGAP